MQKETPEPKFHRFEIPLFLAPLFVSSAHPSMQLPSQGLNSVQAPKSLLKDWVGAWTEGEGDNLRPTWRPCHHPHEEAFSVSLRSDSFAQLLFYKWQPRTWNTSPISPPCSWRLDCSSPRVCLCSKQISSKVRIQQTFWATKISESFYRNRCLVHSWTV